MIVLTMTNCPPKLRGDLTKWLLEINTGVYVGQVNARVREALWKRVCDNIRDGQATMVFNANNEQHMDFYVHNSAWEPVDYDGIKLIRHPLTAANQDNESMKAGFSNAAKQQMGIRKKRQSPFLTEFFILDLETTGLSSENDEILEIGILHIKNKQIFQEYQWMIQPQHPISDDIQKLTGIQNEDLQKNGQQLADTLQTVFAILDDQDVLIYNADFDKGFLLAAAERCKMEYPEIRTHDMFLTAKSSLRGLRSYRLESVAKRLGIEQTQAHRALADCKLLYEVYLKLNKI